MAVAVTLAVPDVPFIEGKPQALRGTVAFLHVVAHAGYLIDLLLHGEIHCEIVSRVAAGFACRRVAIVTMQADRIHQREALLKHLSIPFQKSWHVRPRGSTRDQF